MFTKVRKIQKTKNNPQKNQVKDKESEKVLSKDFKTI